MWILFLLQLLGIWIKCNTAQSPILDSRCFLSTGGSAESFLASEDIAIGSVIGTLNINGNTDNENGDIDLSLRERDAPVKIAPGTKDLVLITPLDKEGQRGPASVYVNVICDRRNTNDPSFVIPVNIRVTDINDNAPQWIAAPYILSLSEVTVPGTRILQGARAIDQDQQGPFSTVEYHVLQGPFSDYVQFISPLEGTLVLKKPLDYEVLKNFTIKLRAQDQGSPPKFSDTLLKVIVIDADDQNPKFLRDSYHADLPTSNSDQLIIKPEQIQAKDQDEGINAPLEYSINPSPEAKYFKINPSNGDVRLVLPFPSDFQHPITLVIKATQIDNPDRYALTTLILTRKGAKQQSEVPLAFLQKAFFTKVREDLGVGSRILSLPTNKVGKKLNYKVLDKEQMQYFKVGSFGELVLLKSLDFEKQVKHIFFVEVSDSVSNDKAEITVEVIDVNDWEPRFRQAHYEFILPNSILNSKEPVALGKLEAADGDRSGEKISMRLKGPFASFFTIDVKGMLWLKSDRPNVTTVHFLAIATDSGLPPKSTSVPVTVRFELAQEARATWAPGILATFGIVLGLFLIVIMVMSFYIHKQRKPKSRIHSQTQSTTSGVNLMTHEYHKSGNGMHLPSNNILIGNPMNTHGGSGSSISAGASTILAASLEREAQKERENYNSTVRNIISRASIARDTRLYEEEMERDSISNDDLPTRTWATNIPENNFVSHGKKLGWDNPHGQIDLMSSIDNIGSTENNLTVYF
uniref:CSON000375 protein n=1 Tax=Culicoides sonorensis TaxID=179676 RepID=A0A336MED8_CULSO